MPVKSNMKILEVSQFKGLNTLDDPRKLDPSQSPYMLNFDLAQDGVLQTRYGYELFTEIVGGDRGMSGCLTYYNTYGTYKGDYLLVFYNGTAYKSTNASPTPISVGSAYGTTSYQTRGTVFANVAIYGDGTGLAVQYDGNTQTTPTNSVNASVFGTYQQRLFVSGVTASPSNVYYSDVDSTNNLSTNPPVTVNVGNGEVTTALVDNFNSLQVYKEDSQYAINFSFDDNYAITTPQLQPIVSSQGGSVAYGSAQPVYSYTYFLSKNGFQSFGPSLDNNASSLPLPLSLVINPTVRGINYTYQDKIVSGWFENKYLCATPLGNVSENSHVFVYNESIKRRFGIDNWVLYDDIPASGFAVYRDSKKRDQLYFTSNTEAKVYRFTKSFSDDGFGYNRIWQSKRFTFGERTHYHYIDVEGFKPKGATIFVDMYLDEKQSQAIEITDANFVNQAAPGGYIGDNYIGDSYLGGANVTVSSTPMFRWRKRIRIPDTVNEGCEWWFQIRNFAENEGFTFTKFRLCYEPLTEDPTYTYTD